ncbi:hypothetical protein B0F90DRAFT_1809706 [Multifurca ochricompacta]|uniref:DUF7330 domain-containing protein n=1 Tax=Multifurca ochricompacta TaxID=376703 RepID=A0AAD4M8C8_9AGAM|nr:hypothetical protein B0F90DRAFT_1809706 [Multifurca ochricompacta]
MFRSVSSPSYQSLRTGTHKVHYQPRQQWDFITDANEHPVDLSLVLPHYRALNQPTGHRMGIYVHSSGEIKSTICRQSSRTPFFFSVCSSGTAPVTLYLPSNFSGRICFSSSPLKVTLSAGFTNHIFPRVRFARLSNSQYEDPDECDEDAGHVALRMWDVVEGAPECVARERWRKMCRRTTSSSKNLRAEQRTLQAIDWDFLLDD